MCQQRYQVCFNGNQVLFLQQGFFWFLSFQASFGFTASNVSHGHCISFPMTCVSDAANACKSVSLEISFVLVQGFCWFSSFLGFFWFCSFQRLLWSIYQLLHKLCPQHFLFMLFISHFFFMKILHILLPCQGAIP